MSVRIQQFPRIIETVDQYGYLEDVLNGLNVRHYNYVGDVQEIECPPDHWLNGRWDHDYETQYERIEVPYVVSIWDDDYYSPEFHHHKFCSTLKQAQEEVAYLEDQGIHPHHIHISEDCMVYRYELEHQRII